ncbi:MAG: NADP-dependent oxidoreductase [Ideonella sp.]|nr:NADP-dependent oxidoreductase [Ideonella sp.]
MSTINRQWQLASRPSGEPTAANFRLVEAPLPELADGEVLVRHHFLSLDPYMRGRMNDAKSYAQPQPLDAVMQGGTAGEVVASRNAEFAVGDKVVGMGGWQEYSVVGAAQRGMLRKVDTTHIPLSAYLGTVGMPGVTAWYGLNRIIAPKAGETVVVSASSGAVGTVVGQLAKIKGCRAVGLAGGPEKCAFVTDVLGFDACIDYRQHPDLKSLSAALKDACPQGIDGYFENVGGVTLDAVLQRMNAFGRIAVCGMIAGYNGAPIPLTQPQLILVSRLLVQGFIVSEHMDVWPQALAEIGALVAAGKLKYRESVAEGLASAPEAFFGMLKGRNFGKQLVRLV